MFANLIFLWNFFYNVIYGMYYISIKKSPKFQNFYQILAKYP